MVNIPWQLPPKLDIPPALLAYVADPLLAQLLARRGLATVQQARPFLEPEAYRPAPPTALPDMEIALARLNRAIERQEQVWVWGDFDVDGQTSTALLVSTLDRLGAGARYYIPNRLSESHGIKLPALQRVLDQGADLILTCDTGVTEHKALAAARAAGPEVIVTDHHDLPDRLPEAVAIINPKRLAPEHPLAELPGVGVAYKLAQALFQAHGRAADSEALLDLVAMGIVADVARQADDTRYLLQRGLAVLQRGSRLGLQALLDNTRLRTDRLTEEHIGFWLAPRLNALGRLGDANLGVELLTTDNLSRARIIALQLEALNDRRKLLVDRVVVQALSQLEDNPALAGYNAIVLAAADWHPGVIGLAASRLADRYGKPALLIALRPDGQGRGSARSVPGCDIHQALKSQAHLLTDFGGHPMAAGVAIAPDNGAAFRRGLSAALADYSPPAERTITLDAWVELPQVTAAMLESIQRLAPFGPGNPRVRLGLRGLRLVGETTFGQTGAHKRVVVEDEAGRRQEVVWWNGAAARSPQGRFDLAFIPGLDSFRGGGAVQLEWVAAREWTPAPVVSPPEFIDWRQAGDVRARVAALEADSLLVWAEGVSWPGLEPVSRTALQPAQALVVGTAPPGRDIFRQVLAQVNPRRIFLVGQSPPFDSLPAFVRQLMGLVKYAVGHRGGELPLAEAAATLGHRPTTVRLGIDWLAAQGKLSIGVDEDELLVVELVQQPPADQVEAVAEMLKAALAETAAYRRFFQQAALASISKGMAGDDEDALPDYRSR